jgi:hypothetical protein
MAGNGLSWAARRVAVETMLRRRTRMERANVRAPSYVAAKSLGPVPQTCADVRSHAILGLGLIIAVVMITPVLGVADIVAS